MSTPEASISQSNRYLAISSAIGVADLEGEMVVVEEDEDDEEEEGEEGEKGVSPPRRG